MVQFRSSLCFCARLMNHSAILEVESRQREMPMLPPRERQQGAVPCTNLAFDLFFHLLTSLATQRYRRKLTQFSKCRHVRSLQQSSCRSEPRSKIHRVQTLADGTTITNDWKEIGARDSQGRTLNVTTTSFDVPSSTPEENSITNAYASDPVAETDSRWSSHYTKATVLKLPSDRHGCWVSNSGGHWAFGPTTPKAPAVASSSKSANAGAATSSRFQITIRNSVPLDYSEQDLGTQVIMGIEAHGRRTVTTTPAGSIGNDKPLVRTSEVWIATGLSTPLRQITADPRTGLETREVISLDLAEPPLSTFQPPEGYEIEMEELHEVPCQQ